MDKRAISIFFLILSLVLTGPGIQVAGKSSALQEGGVYIYGSKLLAPDPQGYSKYGGRLALSQDGQVLVVSAPNYDDPDVSSTGKVYVYRREAGQWNFVQAMMAPDADIGDYFGDALSIANGPDYTLLVSAPRYDMDSYTDLGAVYVYNYNGSDWSLLGKLPIQDASAFSYDRRGTSVAISADGNTAFVGAPGLKEGASGAGAIYVLERDINGDWSQTQRILGPTTDAASMGLAMHLSDDDALLMVAGVYRPEGVLGVIGHGIVRIYQQSGASWGEIASLAASDGELFDDFGASITSADGGNLVLVGADRHGDGQVYTYLHNGVTWEERDIMERPTGSIFSHFGDSLALSEDGTQSVVGAWLNGSGALHVYERSGMMWGLVRTLSNPDGAAENLGWAVVMERSGAFIAGGARDSHSSAGALDYVGAVYIYIPGFEFYLPVMVK